MQVAFAWLVSAPAVVFKTLQLGTSTGQTDRMEPCIPVQLCTNSMPETGQMKVSIVALLPRVQLVSKRISGLNSSGVKVTSALWASLIRTVVLRLADRVTFRRSGFVFRLLPSSPYRAAEVAITLSPTSSSPLLSSSAMSETEVAALPEVSSSPVEGTVMSTELLPLVRKLAEWRRKLSYQ